MNRGFYYFKNKYNNPFNLYLSDFNSWLILMLYISGPPPPPILPPNLQPDERQVRNDSF